MYSAASYNSKSVSSTSIYEIALFLIALSQQKYLFSILQCKFRTSTDVNLSSNKLMGAFNKYVRQAPHIGKNTLTFNLHVFDAV